MSSLQQLARQKKSSRRNLWFERFMAIAATVNLGLVVFNLSYVPWRDFWLTGNIHLLGLTLKIPLPPVTNWYDPIKGIEANRYTVNYLSQVSQLEAQVSQTGLQSSQAKALLEELRRQSGDMIQENWFAGANKSGTLEKIKGRMRDRIYPKSYRGKRSATQAFNTFWSQKHLTDYGWKREIDFFDARIKPLIQTNYFRSIGENGQPTDFFWQIDVWFISLFGLEFLSRTFYISRSHTGLSWIDAMLWRWYDIFLLLPFLRLLRVIPVTIRLHQAELLDLDRVQQQTSQGLVASFAEELTQVVVVRVINQIQGSVERGDVTRFLLQSQNRRPQIHVSDVNEMDAIMNLLVQLTVYQVLPKIQPDVEAILQHNIEGILNQLPLYSSLQNLPGLGNLPTQLTEQLATQVTQTAYNALVTAMEDPVGAKLSSQLMQHFSEALGSEVQKKQTLQEIQNLLLDMLEEVKFNYVKHLTEEDVEKALEETRRLRSRAAAKQTVVQDSLLPGQK